MKNTIKFTKVSSDAYGNSRVVVHFLNFILPTDKEPVLELHDIAIGRAKRIYGQKYRAKHYGGGIVFQSWNNNDLEERIVKLMDEIKEEQ